MFYLNKREVYSKTIKSKEFSAIANGAGSLNLFFPKRRTHRGMKASYFTSYVGGFYRVFSDDTVEIKVTVSVQGPSNEKGYVMGYLYTDPFFNNVETKRELVINLGLEAIETTLF